MARYTVTLTTVADFTITVDAEDEEAAIEAAYSEAPKESLFAGDGKYVNINETWGLREPEVRLEG